MLNTLVTYLKDKGIDYRITEKETISNEFYFIGNKLDMNRKNDVSYINLTVYIKNEDGTLGIASQQLHPTMTVEEMKSAVENLVFSASFAKNPSYELAEPVVSHSENKINSTEICKEIIETIQKKDTGNFSAYEVFVKEHKTHILNSRGLDVSYTNENAFVELIINGKDETKEIELYRSFQFGECNTTDLTKKISDALLLMESRLEAVPTPNLKKGKVLLCGNNVADLLGYYTQKTFTRLIAMKASTYKIDEPIMKESTGDKITLKGVKYLPYSGSNAPFDADGQEIKDEVLIENNICKNYWGNLQFNQYVGIKSCSYNNFVFEGGSKKVEELRTGPYLEVWETSGLSVDAFSGSFSVEIRLGFYHDGEKLIAVTGGSIAGKMQDVETSMLLSTETVQYNNTVVPFMVSMENISITGIE